LRREIIATQLANSMINRGGPPFIVRVADQTGAEPAAIASAFAATRDSYELTALNAAIDDLDNKVSGKLQLDLYLEVQNLLLDRLIWFLRTADFSRGLADVVAHYRAGIAAVESALGESLSPELQAARDARRKELAAARLPDTLAARFADLRPLAAAPDIVLVADRSRNPINRVAATYFAVAAFFGIQRLTGAEIPAADYFDRLALDRARDVIGDAERKLTVAVLADGAWGAHAVDDWAAKHKTEVDRLRSAIGAMASSGLTVSKLAVAASMLDDLTRH
jgi:glutamate dehydrogenase